MKNSGRVSGMIKKKADKKRNLQEELTLLDQKESLLRSQSSSEFQDKYVRQQSGAVGEVVKPCSAGWESTSQPTNYQTHKEASLQCSLPLSVCQPPLCDSCDSIQKLQKQNLRLVEQCVGLLGRKHILQSEITRLARHALSMIERSSGSEEQLIGTIEQIIKTINDEENAQFPQKAAEARQWIKLEEEQAKRIEDLTNNMNRVKEVVMETQEMFEQTKRTIENTSVLDPELFRRDIEDLYVALTSKKLNVSIDQSLMNEKPLNQPVEPHTQFETPEQHVGFDPRITLKSDVTVFDVNHPTIRRELDLQDEEDEPQHDHSLKLNFTKKTQPCELQHYKSMENYNRTVSKNKLLRFSDKRPPKRKGQQPQVTTTDELHMMLLLQAITIERFIEQSDEEVLY